MPASRERIIAALQAMSAVLAKECWLMDWKEAFVYGHLEVEGDSRVKRLLGQAIEKDDAAHRAG